MPLSVEQEQPPPRVREEPLSLDDEEVASPKRPEAPSARPFLVAGLVGGFLLLAGGGATTWLALRTPREPEEGAAVSAPADPVLTGKDPANSSDAKQPVKTGVPVQPASKPGEASSPGSPKALTGEQINLRLLKSTAFIVTVQEGGSGIGCGSGALIHGSRKLVLTNYHVVGENDRALVFFPEYDAKKNLVTSPTHYFDNVKKIATRGKVIARSSKLDLAILELENVPSYIVGLPLAGKPAATGASVYSLGGSGVNLRAFSGVAGDAGALWRFTTGTVRGRHRHSHQFKDGQKVEAMILETQSPVNPGDSGGPTVNERGEIVGIVASTSLRDQLVSQSIDLTEVREHLEGAAKAGGWAWNDAKAAPQVPPDAGEVSPVVLLARMKSGAAVQRVEAVDQLGQHGEKAQFAVPDLIALLDDPDDVVRRATFEALERIGPPAAGDAACVPRALAGTGRYARLYALKHYSRIETASTEQLPLIAGALNDTDLATREQALSALERFGPKCKPAAFPALLDRLLDSDAIFVARIVKTLVAFAPYDGADRKLLIDSLRHKSSQLRYTAVVLLAASAPDEILASVWFESLLKDPSADVRAAALPALARWPGAMKRIQPALIGLVRDDDVTLRAAAIRALGEYGTGAEAKTALVALIGPGSSAESRDLAIQSLLKLNPTDAKTDVPIYAALLKLDDAKVKAATFAKAAGLKAEAKELLPQIGDGLKHADADVQTEALKLAAAIGPEAASLAPQVSAFLTGGSKAAERVQIQAVETLVQFGSAKDTLLTAIAAPLPAPVLKRVCDSLGRKGAEVPPKQIPHLFVLAESNEELRSPLGDLIARIGGDDITRLCAERTYWSFKTLGNGQKVKECKYELAVQVWAIDTMGRLDPKAMSEKGRAILIERTKSLSRTNPDLDCRKAADAAHAKLVAAGLGEKP